MRLKSPFTEVCLTGHAPLRVELRVTPNIGTEGFLIEDCLSGGVRITGHDERGLLYGVGKFLRTSCYGLAGFSPGSWRGASVPQKPLRGIYFATHFHNFYHDAPIEEIQRYVEDLGLWGYNVLTVWYDMHHFNGFDDPQAVAHRARLYAICEAARRIGLDVGFMMIANEGYNDSPVALRADPRGRRGGWYDCVVCPNQVGGTEYVLRVLGQAFAWCADLQPRYVCLWPYDQGGCGCERCRPWGANGFLKVAETVAARVREKLPTAKVIVSTWFFDDLEWQGLDKRLAMKKPWADMILAGRSTCPAPGGLPMIGFPEISMHETFPWGGFGATPLTQRAQDQWQADNSVFIGGIPYSEGIYEDMTKAVYSQLYWNDQPAEDTLREYIAFEYSSEEVEDILKVIATLEQNHHWRWWPGKLEGVKLELDWFPSKGALPQDDPGAEEAYETVKRVDAKLQPWARRAWRWRILFLRVLLDAELKAEGGVPNDRCRDAFAELIEIYSAQYANPVVRPPLLLRNRMSTRPVESNG